MSTQALETVKTYIEKGVDDIIENKDDFITNLAIAANITVKGSKTKISNNGPKKNNLKDMSKILEKDGHRIERDENTWPLYHLYLKSGEVHNILFKGKVEQFHDILLEKGIEGLLTYEVK